VLPPEPVLPTQAKPRYSSPDPLGLRVGNGTDVEVGLLRVPLWLPSSAQTVLVPRPAVNSWALYSGLSLEISPDQLTVMVEGPVEVTVPYQISTSWPFA